MVKESLFNAKTREPTLSKKVNMEGELCQERRLSPYFFMSAGSI